VLDVKVLRGDDRFGFTDAAVRALRGARYSPAMKDGKHVKTWLAADDPVQAQRLTLERNPLETIESCAEVTRVAAEVLAQRVDDMIGFDVDRSRAGAAGEILHDVDEAVRPSLRR